MDTSVITVKGQVLIPAKLRLKHGIKQGTKVIFIEQNGDLIIKPLTKEYFNQYAGLLDKSSKALDVMMTERKKDKAKGK